MTSYKEINRIKELREREKLTQQELADEMQTTKLTISNWENGKHALKTDKAQQLADFFGVSTPYLMGYDHPEKSIADLKEKLVDAIKEIKQYRLLKVGLDDFIAEKDVLNLIDDIFS